MLFACICHNSSTYSCNHCTRSHLKEISIKLRPIILCPTCALVTSDLNDECTWPLDTWVLRHWCTMPAFISLWQYASVLIIHAGAVYPLQCISIHLSEFPSSILHFRNIQLSSCGLGMWLHEKYILLVCKVIQIHSHIQRTSCDCMHKSSEIFPPYGAMSFHIPLVVWDMKHTISTIYDWQIRIMLLSHFPHKFWCSIVHVSHSLSNWRFSFLLCWLLNLEWWSFEHVKWFFYTNTFLVLFIDPHLITHHSTIIGVC